MRLGWQSDTKLWVQNIKDNNTAAIALYQASSINFVDVPNQILKKMQSATQAIDFSKMEIPLKPFGATCVHLLSVFQA